MGRCIDVCGDDSLEFTISKYIKDGGEGAKMRKVLLSVAVFSLLAITSYAEDKKVISEEELGLRKTALFSEDKVAPVDAKFTTAAPGTSKKFERSYMNAPPLIPHSVEGLIPITKNNNQCLGCHMPEVAKSMGATPLPPSHFTDFRPKTELGKDGKVIKDGKVFKNTADLKVAEFKKMKKLTPARFNCTQCHVPQANVKPLVENKFKPDFKDEKLKSKSNLIDVITEGVK